MLSACLGWIREESVGAFRPVAAVVAKWRDGIGIGDQWEVGVLETAEEREERILGGRVT
jgi:hypothetical protein